MTKIKTKIDEFSPKMRFERKTYFSLNYDITKLDHFSLAEFYSITIGQDGRLFRFKTVFSNSDSKYSCTISNHFFYLRFKISLYKCTQKHSRITCTEDVMKIKKVELKIQ